MEILLLAVKAINYVLLAAFTWISAFFEAFGLSWLGVITGLAVISAVLRLFASNLVGAAVHLGRNHEQAAVQQRIEKSKSRAAVRRGASTSSRLRQSEYDFGGPRSNAARDRFVSKSRNSRKG